MLCHTAKVKFTRHILFVLYLLLVIVKIIGAQCIYSVVVPDWLRITVMLHGGNSSE